MHGEETEEARGEEGEECQVDKDDPCERRREVPAGGGGVFHAAAAGTDEPGTFG